MKKLILILIALFSTLCFAKSNDEIICQKRLLEHLDIVESSQKELSSLALNPKGISTYAISQLQKSITHRFVSLKKFMTFYEDDRSNCGSFLVSKAVAIYDFTLFGNVALVNSELRRIIEDFANYRQYGLEEFMASYKKYTSNKYIDHIRNEIQGEATTLPQGITLEDSVRKKVTTLGDRAIKGAGLVITGVARLLGFISDHLIFRDGRLQDNEIAFNLIKNKLKPLDLIFEKRKFVITNYTIPGNWGHVAIWLGTKKELQDLGVWDQPYFEPFRAQVLAGKSILEIRKKGVNYVSLNDFLNLDEIAVTRIKNAKENADLIFNELSQQIGKRYDFQFDAHTLSKITCAELIAFSFGDISWPQNKTLFQTIMRPDDIAVLTTYQNPQEEFVLYLSGNRNKTFENLNFDQWKELYRNKTPPKLRH
jgi:Permuted papain-like amidase enzyme, YaeF/YiiX, C92 family